RHVASCPTRRSSDLFEELYVVINGFSGLAQFLHFFVTLFRNVGKLRSPSLLFFEGKLLDPETRLLHFGKSLLLPFGREFASALRSEEHTSELQSREN